MKKYTMLSAVWLFACGTGAGQEPQDDSTLQSPLTANDDDDDATDPTEPASTGDAGDTGGTQEPEWSGASDCDGPTSAVPGGTVSADPGSAAPGTEPALVIGAGGTAWAPPQNASVVWCNVDVPIGCAAISPAPEGGRLVVVHAMTEAGGSEIGAPEFANAGEPTTNAGSPFVVYASPVSGGTAPSTEVPVIIGGSLPPLPGTCVAVTFPTGGEPSVGTPITAGTAGTRNAGGESASVPAGAPALPSSPPAPASGATAAGTAAFPTTLPALPPPGECLGVTFPAPTPGYPAVPGQPVPGGNVAPVPAAPAAGACVNVAFATSGHPNQPPPSQAPVMCAFPVTSPVPGVAAAPSAGSESTPDEDVR
jgi:hypothetical protein